MSNADSALFDQTAQALDAFQIEIPSWGFANTGTRFGKFVQTAAASTLEEKFADDNLSIGSIDPCRVFRIFHEVHSGLA